jgi:hypothetical protein
MMTIVIPAKKDFAFPAGAACFGAAEDELGAEVEAIRIFGFKENYETIMLKSIAPQL